MNKSYLLLGLGLILTCFISIFIFTIPAFNIRFNLANISTSNIGSTIGGITSPILGIFSSIFLYITLTKQIDANEKSQLKNESDIIFLLMNQFDSEYDKFYYKFYKGEGKERIEYKLTGLEAMHEFVNDFYFRDSGLNYSEHYMFQSKQISSLIKSFALINKRIEISMLSPSLKGQFEEKLKNIFICKFHFEVFLIISKSKQEQMEDILVEELKSFFNYYVIKYNIETISEPSNG